MKKILKIAWQIICFCVGFIYILASFSSFISPFVFSFISLFAIAFPYIFLLLFIIFCIEILISRKSALLLLCLLALGFINIKNSFAFNKNTWQAKKPISAFRILTWNVEEFVSILPQQFPEAQTRIKMLQFINNMHPDVLCLQEYWNVENDPWLVSVRHELDSLGYHYHYFSNDSIKIYAPDIVQKHCSAIFSLHPLLDSGRINIITKGFKEKLAYADVEFNNKRARIFTAHLQSFALYPDTSKASDKGRSIYKKTYDRKHTIAGKLRHTDEIHEKEALIIKNMIDKSPYPVVYCGDMNSTPTTHTYKIIKGEMQDAFLEKGFGFGGTFYKILPTIRIDYCFADKNFKVVQSKVETQKLSDHYPVITDLEWK